MKTYNLLENDKFAEIINKQSRLIGIDHGKKNIGIAISDENHNIATPLTTIEFTQLKHFLIEIKNIIKENNVEAIVIGNPINMDGSLGPRAQSAKDFSKSLTEQLCIPVTLWDERLSSEGAYKGMSELSINVTKKKKKLDENSAAFILQGFLDYYKIKQNK
jgi:putative Holliday junction resolvase